MPKEQEIRYNDNQVVNTYNLLKRAYGDDFKLKYEDYEKKVKTEEDPQLDEQISSLLKNAYPDQLTDFNAQKFRSSLHFDPEKEQLYQLKGEKERIKGEIEKIDKGESFAPIEDKEYIAKEGKVKNLEAPEEVRKYREKQLKRLEAQTGRLDLVEQVQENVNQMDNATYDKIGNAEMYNDVKELVDIDTYNYIKKDKESDLRKRSYDKILATTDNPDYHLSVYNQSKLDVDRKDNPELRKKLQNAGIFEMTDYEQVVETLEKAANQYAEGKDDKRAKKKFYAMVAPYLLFDKKGNLTPFAIQNSAKLLLNRIDAVSQDAYQERVKADKEYDKYTGKRIWSGDLVKNEEEKAKLREAGIKSYRAKENVRLLDETKRILENTILQPTGRAGLRGLKTGAQTVDWMDQATIGVKSIFDTVDMLELSKKFQSGDQLTESEQILLDAYSMNQFMTQRTNPGMWHNVSQGVLQMPAYMVGFAISGGAYSGTKAAARKMLGVTAEKKAVKGIGRKALQWGYRTGLPGAIATVPATIVNPSTSIIENAAEKMTNISTVAFSDDMDQIVGEFIDESGFDPVKAIAKGGASAYFENLFERSGEHIMKGASELIGTGKKALAKRNWAQKLLLSNYSDLKGLKTTKNLKRHLKTFGWSGIAEEMIEEYSTKIVDELVQEGEVNFSWEEFATIGLTVAAFGAPFQVANIAAEQYDKNNTALQYTLNGKEKSIRIPTKIWNEIEKIDFSKDVDTSKIFDTLLRGKKLNKNQLNFITSYMVSEKQKSNNEISEKEVKKDIKKPTKEKAENKEQTVGLFDEYEKIEEQKQDIISEGGATELKQELEVRQEEIQKEIGNKYHKKDIETFEETKPAELQEGESYVLEKKVGENVYTIPVEVTGFAANNRIKVKYEDGKTDFIDSSPENRFLNTKEKIDVDVDQKKAEIEQQRQAELQEAEKITDGRKKGPRIKSINKKYDQEIEELEEIKKEQVSKKEKEEKKEIDEKNQKLLDLLPEEVQKEVLKIPEGEERDKFLRNKVRIQDKDPLVRAAARYSESKGIPYTEAKTFIKESIEQDIPVKEYTEELNKQDTLFKELEFEEKDRKGELEPEKTGIDIFDKEYEKYEDFEKDFLKDESFLNNLQIPLDNARRKAARKNLLEGKTKTLQAKTLKKAIKDAYEKGGIELVQGKGVSVEKQIAPIKKKEPKKEPTEKQLESKGWASQLEALANKNIEKIKTDKKGKLSVSVIPGLTQENIEQAVWQAVKVFAKTAKSIDELINNIVQYFKDNVGVTDEYIDHLENYVRYQFENPTPNIKEFIDLFMGKKGSYISPKGFAVTELEKISAHRRAFSSIFKYASEANGIDKNKLEKEFFEVIVSYDQKIKNQSDYDKFLNTLIDKYPNMQAVVSQLKLDWDLDRFISLSNFYKNVRLIEQLSVIHGTSGFKIKSLNKEDYTSKISEDFINYLDNMRDEFGDKVENVDQHIINLMGKYHSDIKQIPKDRSVDSKERVFNRQLKLLQELTGIHVNTWREYFSPITKETIVQLRKKDEDGNVYYEEVSFKDYDSIINFNHSDLNNGVEKLDIGIVKTKEEKKGDYVTSDVFFEPDKVKADPALIKNLILAIDKSTAEGKTKKQALKDYFTKSPGKGIPSNLRKLSSALTQNEDVNIFGNDIEGNRFSSFIMYSHLLNIAENINNYNIDNELAKFHKEKGYIPIKILNGMVNESTSATSVNKELSDKEYWMSQAALFKENMDSESYYGTLGQFGDKKQIFLAEFKNRKGKLEDLGLKNVAKARKFVRKMLSNAVIKSKLGINKNFDQFVDAFLYNYASNMKDAMQIFHGENYKDLTELVKRAGSTNSTGYRLDENIEGGIGPEYNHIVIKDQNYSDELGLSTDRFDGILFFTDEFSGQIAKSMGSLYNRLDEFGNLSSVKALFSGVKNKKRGLTKTNWVNVGLLAKDYGENHIYHKINEFMKANGIQTLSFDSGTKKMEQGQLLELFDEEGNLKEVKKSDLHKDYIFTRNTSDTYVQQDLRHTNKPNITKQPSQLIANILALPHSKEMIDLINNQVQITMDELLSTFDKMDNTEQKLNFIKSLLDQEMQKDLYDLIEAGATLSEPGFRNIMTTRLTSYVTKNALEVFSYRTTSQELPADKDLKGYREVVHNGKKHILLAEIDTNIKGARYGEQMNSQKEAIDKVKKNKKKYRDLYDIDGKLKEWEIIDGYIPGEYVLSTRVPADDLHSHTFGRLRNQITAGNFTVLDKESQARSGSDYDGDQRFNQTLYHMGGVTKLDETREGLYNKFLLYMAEDYTNPENLQKILNPIDTDKYNGIVDKFKESEDQYELNDPEGLEDARKKNMMGNVMKGILTNLTTVYSFLSKLELKSKVKFELNKDLQVNGFPKDEFNKMKNTLGILLNLAFDNAKDPRIEIMGLNEVTANMFILMLVGNKGLDTISEAEQDQRIYDRLDKIAAYFNSPLAKEFISLKRSSNTSLFQQTDKEIFEELEKKGKDSKTAWKASDVTKLKSLYYLGQELFEFKSFHYLTQELPSTTADFLNAERIMNKFITNSGSLIDTSNIENVIPAFKEIKNIMSFARNVLLNHTVEISRSGNRMMEQIKKDAGKKRLTKDDIYKINKSLNDYITISTLSFLTNEYYDNPKTIKEIGEALSSSWNSIANKYSGNKFIDKIQINKNKTIQISDDYRFAQLSENELAEIRNDFDKLSEKLKYSLALYSFSMYGIGTSTYRGGFYNLMSNDFKAELSQHIEQDVKSWVRGEVTKFELKNAKQWIYNINPGLGLATNLGTNNKWDINSYPALDISNDMLTEISSINSAEEYNNLVNERIRPIFEREYKEYKKKYPSIKIPGFAKEMAEKGMGHALNKINPKEFMKQELSIEMRKERQNEYKHCKK